MSKRNLPSRESKKPKKGSKKPVISDIIEPPTTVEVVKKRHKKETKE